jgi:DNA-directed RNA polymerase beta' subunit
MSGDASPSPSDDATTRVRLRLASPEDVLAWSCGEVTEPTTYHPRSGKPELNGMFCERIFGPVNDWECRCGACKGQRLENTVCPKCGVTVLPSRVRRQRLGHIELAAPVVHIWFFKNRPSPLALLLGIKPSLLEAIIYGRLAVVRSPERSQLRAGQRLSLEEHQLARDLFGDTFAVDRYQPVLPLPAAVSAAAGISLDDYERALDQGPVPEVNRFARVLQVLEPGKASVRRGQLLREPLARRARQLFGPEFESDTGAEAVLRMLRALDLPALSAELRSQLDGLKREGAPEQKLTAVGRRLRVVEALRGSGTPPEWMVLTRLPVLPPDLRPMVPLESGKFASSELNDLYRRLINRNTRLKRLRERPDTPERILLNERRLLQQAVDAVLDNQRCPQPVQGRRRRPVKSLTDLLTGKHGRFRSNLLGKRVDYSARAVIVSGPELQVHQCGLPRTIALKLYEPFLIKQLMDLGLARTIGKGRDLLAEMEHPGRLRRIARDVVHELGHALAVQHAQRVLGQAGPPLRLPESDRERARCNAEAILAEWGSSRALKRAADVLQELGPVGVVQEAQVRLKHSGPGAALRWVRGVLQRRQDLVWELLEEVSHNHPVLLNRAPTLHRMGIQAFEPVLVRGNALRLHPLVCKGFNADFDGDQMAVHLPLSIEAQVEASVLMMSTNNIFSPANGQPVLSPSLDIVLGCAYLTTAVLECGDSSPRLLFPSPPVTEKKAAIHRRTPNPPLPVQFTPPVTTQGEGKTFAGPVEVQLAHTLGKVGIHARVRMRLPRAQACNLVVTEQHQEGGACPAGGLIETTVGRVLFNASLPAGMPFYNLSMDAKRLGRVLADCHERLGPRTALELADRLKRLGFEASTRSGLSFATDDLPLPRDKAATVEAAEKAVERLQAAYRDGNLSAEEYSARLLQLWAEAQKQLTEQLLPDLKYDRRGGLPYLNPIHLMAESGARGNRDQVRQLAAMRGLMAGASGRVIERAVVASLREGLPSWDYFLSAHGARKGMTDKGLRTAEAGYLTRKLIDVAQHVVVALHDCGSTLGITRRRQASSGVASAPRVGLRAQLRGRVSRQTVTDAHGGVIVRENEVIGAEQAARLEALGVEAVEVRSPLTCRAAHGVCQLCYGVDLTTGQLAEQGLAVGIVAAQSIGEPGTQLVLRTFHIGGIAGQDVANDLDRVTRLLDASEPSDPAVLVPVSGRVRQAREGTEEGATRTVWIRPTTPDGKPLGAEVALEVPLRKGLRVRDGDRVEAGAPLNGGAINPHELLRHVGPDAVQEYLLREVQAVYRYHGLEIDDRHFEVIVAQMLRKVRVESPGDTDLLPEQLMDRVAFQALVAELGRQRRRPPTCRPCLLGITKAAIQADSFIAAASFQETTRILTEAALAGRADPLTGLKESVILGLPIPAGTGLRALQCARAVVRDPSPQRPTEKPPRTL